MYLARSRQAIHPVFRDDVGFISLVGCSCRHFGVEFFKNEEGEWLVMYD